MSQQPTDPVRDTAWGDVMLPEEAKTQPGTQPQPARQSQDAARTPAASGAPSEQTGQASTTAEPSLREDTNAYAFGATTQMPTRAAGYARLPLGPGNEAMEGGASPAPRGYTGGAMGKFVAGLSPSFADAARGDPAPGGDHLYTPSEAATTFGPGSGIAHPGAAPEPPAALNPAGQPGVLEAPTDSGTG